MPSGDFRRFSFRIPSGPKKSLTKPVRVYQPTYQLNPRKRFNVEKVQKILAQLLDPELEEVEYSEKVVPELCVTLAESIRNAVKEENYDRYRIIVNVTISQRRQQSLVASHSFLWDSDRDNFAAREFHNPHIHAFAVVYAVYFD
ncbi:dynein light chain Tctex-type 5-like [Leguminivora glycinivorella]|uniref:dynein light chain Tctex-type 5-like n=1 Tax=Leguminivora glycinivorella TaxID=1035111 RepID=UPI00200D76D9|nr:dynein light chain Tctex-type 5-like [Leguminivora glycinivorella]